VFELFPNPGAGWGDPLTRQPRLVARDLAAGRVGRDDALAVYGVVVDDAGAVDAAATDARRAWLRRRRLDAARAPLRPLNATVAVATGAPRIIEGVAVVAAEGHAAFACEACGTLLSDGHDTYRWGCAQLDVRPADISPLYVSPARETGDDYLVRSYLCPGCGLALDAHLCRPDDLPFTDVCLL
jgi:N-methylhydantoinase B